MALRTDLARRLTLRASGELDGDRNTSLAEQPEQQSRQEVIRRLQFGVGGVLTMFLLVGLANVINDRANQADALTVAEAAPVATPSVDRLKDDPLVSAGVVPDLPPETAPQPRGAESPLVTAPAE